MEILFKVTLTKFIKKYPSASEPLNKWYEIVRLANLSKISDIKKVFNNVDYIGNDR